MTICGTIDEDWIPYWPQKLQQLEVSVTSIGLLHKIPTSLTTLDASVLHSSKTDIETFCKEKRAKRFEFMSVSRTAQIKLHCKW